MLSENSELGDTIRRLRRQRDWTQRQLAERVGVDYKNISNYEVGRLIPSKKTLARLADTFGLEIRELVASESKEPTIAITDPELLNLFREISAFPDGERSHLKWMLTAIVRQKKMQEMMAN